jgi:hypothetical protein
MSRTGWAVRSILIGMRLGFLPCFSDFARLRYGSGAEVAAPQWAVSTTVKLRHSPDIRKRLTGVLRNRYQNGMANPLFTRGPIIALFVCASCAIGFCGEINDAARTGDLPKVKALLKENPALVSSTAFDGWTPLYEAADNGYFAMAEVLIANGAEVDVRSKDGRSPLYLATIYDHRDIVKLFLAHGADPNVKDDDGVTPLHLAAWHGYEDVAKLLLAHGADVSERNKNGETPLDWATERGNAGMKKLLSKAKSK